MSAFTIGLDYGTNYVQATVLRCVESSGGNTARGSIFRKLLGFQGPG